MGFALFGEELCFDELGSLGKLLPFQVIFFGFLGVKVVFGCEGRGANSHSAA